MYRILTALVLLLGIIWLAQNPNASAQIGQLGCGAVNQHSLVFQPCGVSGGSGRTCTDGTHAAAFNARTSGQDNTHLDANCVFINGLDTDSLYASGDIAYLIATDTAGNSALNIFGSGFTFTPTNSPTFTADRGYVGGSTSNIDTNFNPSTNGVTYLQNSASLFGWSLTNFTSGVNYGTMVGLHSGSPVLAMTPHYSNDSYFMAINSTTNASDSFTGHFYGIERNISSGSSQEDAYVDAASTAGAGDTSTAPPNLNIILLNDDVGSVNGRPFTGNLAFFWAGGTIGATQQAKLCHRVNVYLTTIAGAPGGVC
jgi:hypothetical protein